MSRAAFLAGAAALLFGCGGDPFELAPLPAVDALAPDAGAPLGDGSADAPPPDRAVAVDAGAPEVLEDAPSSPDAPPLEAAAPLEAGPPPAAVCCQGQAPIACGAGAGFACYPPDSRCSASCQTLADGGSWCTAACTGTPSSCSPAACTLGAQCLYTARGQTWPGTIGRCD